MAGAKAIKTLETIYARTDEQIREILAANPPPYENYSFEMVFDGGGAALTVGMNSQADIPIPGRIIDAHMFVGATDPVTSATVTVYLASWASYPTSVILHNTGTIPTLAGVQKAAQNISGWYQYVALQDVLSWQLTTFTGTAQHLTLSLLIQKLPANPVISPITNLAADQMTNLAGDPMVVRR